MSNAKLNERFAIVATVDPGSKTAAAYNTDWVAMQDIRRVNFIVMTGTLGSSATVDFKLQEATDSSGTSAADISGKSITQLTQAGTDDNKQATVEVNASELSTGFTHVRGVLTVGTATSSVAVIALGGAVRFKPASDFDLSSVDEIVG